MSEFSRLTNVHEGLAVPLDSVEVEVVKGTYEFYHYLCDGIDDRGWGCGYRTLQTIASWIRYTAGGKAPSQEPSLHQIQQTLVKLEDKVPSFVGSREWIGSFEICLCLDQIYNVSSKIVHVPNGKMVLEKSSEILEHFKSCGSPAMIGGNTDSASKTLLGVCRDKRGDYHFLIADPHFIGNCPGKSLLQREGWVRWKTQEETFLEESFYNFCLPQFHHEQVSVVSDICQ